MTPQEIAAKAVRERGYLVIAEPPHAPIWKSGHTMRSICVAIDGGGIESPLGVPCAVVCETDADDYMEQAVLIWGGENTGALPCWDGYRYYRVTAD